MVLELFLGVPQSICLLAENFSPPPPDSPGWLAGWLAGVDPSAGRRRAVQKAPSRVPFPMPLRMWTACFPSGREGGTEGREKAHRRHQRRAPRLCLAWLAPLRLLRPSRPLPSRLCCANAAPAPGPALRQRAADGACPPSVGRPAGMAAAAPSGKGRWGQVLHCGGCRSCSSRVTEYGLKFMRTQKGLPAWHARFPGGEGGPLSPGELLPVWGSTTAWAGGRIPYRR